MNGENGDVGRLSAVVNFFLIRSRKILFSVLSLGVMEGIINFLNQFSKGVRKEEAGLKVLGMLSGLPLPCTEGKLG